MHSLTHLLIIQAITLTGELWNAPAVSAPVGKPIRKVPGALAARVPFTKPPSFTCSLSGEVKARLTLTTLLRWAVKADTQTVSGGARP